MLVPAVAVTPQTQGFNFLFGVKQSESKESLRNKNMLLMGYKNLYFLVVIIEYQIGKPSYY